MAFEPSGWSYSQQLTGAEPGGLVPDLPLLIDENSVDAEFWNHVQDGGGDIRVSADDAGQSQIPVDVGYCVVSTQKLQLYVNRGAYTVAEAGRKIYVFAGNAGQTQPASSAAFGRNEVHESRVVAAHFNEATGPAADSTGAQSFTDDGTVTYDGNAVTLGVDSGLLFANAAGYEGLPSSGYTLYLDLEIPVMGATWSTLFEITSSMLRISRRGGSNDLAFNHDGVEIRLSGGDYAKMVGVGRVQAAFTWDGSTVSFYLNGALENSAAFATPTGSGFTETRIGYSQFAWGSQAKIYDAWFVATARNANAIAIASANQSSPSAFWTQSAPVIVGAVSPLVVDDGTISVASDTVTLTKQGALSVDSGTVSIDSDMVTLAKSSVVAASDSSITIQSDSLQLERLSTLAVSDGAVTISSDNVTLLSADSLQVQSATISISSDNVTLQKSSSIAPLDGTIQVSSDSVQLVAIKALAVDSSTISISSLGPVLRKRSAVSVHDSAISINSENVALTSSQSMTIHDGIIQISSDDVQLAGVQTLAADNSTIQISSPALTLIKVGEIVRAKNYKARMRLGRLSARFYFN